MILDAVKPRRSFAIFGAIFSLSTVLLFAAPAMAETTTTQSMLGALKADTDEARIAQLVIANHILALHGVVDGFGHVSFRSVKTPSHFFMSRERAPALVTKDDIIEFDADSRPVDPRYTNADMYSERFIHGEIYRARPDVQSVVHSHTPSVLPFTVTDAPLKALVHVGSFLGTEAAPIFEIRDAGGEDNGMLVNNAKLGAALAKTLGARTVVLMRGHGMAAVGTSIPFAVVHAIYTQTNAQIEIEALKLGKPKFLNAFEAKRVDRIDRIWEVWTAEAEGRIALPLGH